MEGSPRGWLPHRAAAALHPRGDLPGGPYVPSPTAWPCLLCSSLPPARGKLRHAARVSWQDKVSHAEEAPEESGFALTASGSQPQQAGQAEASEDNPCPILGGEINNAACVALCFHRFCFGCIQRWAAMRAVSPLCRRPFDRVLRVLPADEEDGAGSSACRQRKVAREGSRSKSPRRRYVLDRSAISNEPPARRRRPVGSDRALRGDSFRAPKHHLPAGSCT